MSYSSKINEVVNDTVSTFLTMISEKYSLDYDELSAEWNRTSTNTPSTLNKKEKQAEKQQPEKKQPVKSSISNAELHLQTVDILKGICKDRGLKCSGKKSELIDRIKESNNEDKTDENSGENSGENSDLKPAVKLQTKVQNNKSKTLPDIYKKIEKNCLAIRRNAFGNYEHEETGFLFNDTKKVHGVQLKDGSIRLLNKDDFDLCNKFKFMYIIPDNLNENIQDDDEDVEIEEEYEEEYEEEEENQGLEEKQEREGKEVEIVEEEVEIEEEQYEEEEEITEEELLQSEDEEEEEIEDDE